MNGADWRPDSAAEGNAMIFLALIGYFSLVAAIIIIWRRQEELNERLKDVLVERYGQETGFLDDLDRM